MLNKCVEVFNKLIQKKDFTDDDLFNASLKRKFVIQCSGICHSSVSEPIKIWNNCVQFYLLTHTVSESEQRKHTEYDLCCIVLIRLCKARLIELGHVKYLCLTQTEHRIIAHYINWDCLICKMYVRDKLITMKDRICLEVEHFQILEHAVNNSIYHANAEITSIACEIL